MVNSLRDMTIRFSLFRMPLLMVLTITVGVLFGLKSATAGEIRPGVLVGEWEWSAADSRMQTRAFERLSIFADGTLVRYHGTLPQRLYVIRIKEQRGLWNLNNDASIAVKLAEPRNAGDSDRRKRQPVKVNPRELVESQSLNLVRVSKTELVVDGPSGKRVFTRVRG